MSPAGAGLLNAIRGGDEPIRSAAPGCLAVGCYGVYTALYVPAMLIGPPVPLLLIGFIAQVVCAIVAALGLWTGRAWAGAMLLLLGVSIAATQLFEILLGIVPLVRAVLIAVLAIVIALLLARFIRAQPAWTNPD
jgi:uncharacterized membrane protein (DUF2068 family)